MGLCSYCGQPAGFLRSQHPECRARYERAMSMMPSFFAKFLDSQVPAGRFSELLQGAAKAAYVPPEDLAALSVAEIGRIIASLFDEHPPAVGEVQRVAELIEQLGDGVSDNPSLNEQLAKAVVVAGLYEGHLPDAVSVAGPMPIDLGHDESIIWIFNHVLSYRGGAAGRDGSNGGGLGNGMDGTYRSPRMLNGIKAPANAAEEQAEGDLVITSRNIYFLLSHEDGHRIPINRIQFLHAFADGIRVSNSEKKSRVFLLDDPCFALNVIGRISKLTDS